MDIYIHRHQRKSTAFGFFTM
jgi:hypothetical protein